MKIVMTTTAPELNATVDPRFGRAAYLLLIDTNTHEWEAQTNPGANSTGGAGIQAAQFAANYQVQAAISGDFGPHAFAALKAAGIAMYLYGDCRTVGEALECFKAGLLQQVNTPTRSDCDAGHGGIHTKDA
jgi:predicted Fe-Mo cluster-binding NifX family protein